MHAARAYEGHNELEECLDNDGRSVASTVCVMKWQKRHDLAIFASHFRGRVHLEKKYHLESGLYQRDEDPHGFSVKQVPMSLRGESLSVGVALVNEWI